MDKSLTEKDWDKALDDPEFIRLALKYFVARAFEQHERWRIDGQNEARKI